MEKFAVSYRCVCKCDVSVCKCNGMCDIVTHYTNNTLVSDGASSY